jgi:hypothetical protein
MKSGLPTIAVRDIELQRRENDLVLGTFGRGIYILDDYTPLRGLTAAARRQEGVLFAPRPARVFVAASYERGATGNGLFVGENPEFGAPITYHLANAQPPGSEIVVTIADASGRAVREVAGPSTAGLHRVVWNLRASAPEAAADAPGRGGRAAAGGRGTGDAAGGRGAAGRGAGGRGAGGGGRGGGGGGALVSPGTFSLQLNRRVGGALTPLGQPQRLQVVPLDWAGPPAR